MNIVKNPDGTVIDSDTGAALVATGDVSNWRAKGPLMRSQTYVNEATGEVGTLFEQIEEAPVPPESV